MTVYFTSDLHLNHTNILAYTDRPFANIEQMNEAIIDNINSTVGIADTLYILGDIAMGQNKLQQYEELLNKIECKDVHLVLGNHDIHNLKLLEGLGFASVSDYKEISFGKHRRAVLSHYPMASWNGSCHGAYMLHGHIHATRDYNEDTRFDGIRRYDVGVDANNYTPISFEEIEEFFSEMEPDIDGFHGELDFARGVGRDPRR